MLISRIKVEMDKRGLKHRWVAEQMGVAPTVLSRWANNRGYPSVERLYKLARVIGCTTDDLYEWAEK